MTSSAWKLYDFLLVDTFGDGWRNSYLTVQDGNTTYKYTIDCSCFAVQLNSTSEVLTFNVSSDGPPIAPWEIFWAANFSGNVVVGDFDTSAYVNGDFVSVTNPVNYNADSSDNECHECTHPPPRHLLAAAAGPGPSPPPPAKVIMELYSGAWYNGNGGWTAICDTRDSGPDDILVPDIVVYPKYYIMNDMRTKVLQEGTVCKDRSTEYCEEPLPHNGNFVFRVTGFNSDASWNFCDTEGSMKEELVFSMKDGKCSPIRTHTAADYCAGIVSFMVLTGTMSVNDVQGDTLSAFDTKMLEQQITSLFPFHREVAITAYSTQDEVMTVSFKVIVAAEDYGVDGTFDTNIESLFSQLVEGVQTPVSEGKFLSLLRASLTGSPQGNADALSTMSSVSLVGVELASVEFGLVPATVEQPAASPASDETVSVPTTHKEFVLSATVAYACAGAAAFTLLAFVLVRAVKRNSESRTKSHIPLPVDSEHEGTSLEMGDSVEDDVIPKFNLTGKSEKAYFRSSERV